jgi:hypothetical protein
MNGKCPIFKYMKSGWCLNSDCRYFFPGKNKAEYCKYSEMAVLKKADAERAKRQRQMFKESVGGIK